MNSEQLSEKKAALNRRPHTKHESFMVQCLERQKVVRKIAPRAMFQVYICSLNMTLDSYSADSKKDSYIGLALQDTLLLLEPLKIHRRALL